MPYEIEIPGRAVVEVPDSVPLDVAQKHISQQFPATGDEIAQSLKEDPSYIPTKEQFKTFEKWRETKGTDWINSIAEGISGILSTATSATTEAVINGASLNPANYIEGIAQGFNQLRQVLTESQDPSSVLFNFKDWATGDGTESSRYDQFVQARKYNEQMAKYASGEDTVLPKELVNPTFAQGVALFADPTMFLPAVGEALGVGKLALKAVGKATKAAGAVAEAVAKPIESGVSAVSRAITDASGMAPETMRSAGLSAGVASAVAGHPLIAGAAALPSLVSSGVDLAEAISRTGEGLATQPSRIGALEFAGTRPDASLRQKLLGVVGRYGGDTVLDFGLRGAAGAAEGAAIGGALGAASGGQEGAAQGIGSGLAAGALGSVAGRALGQLTGKAALEARAGDLSRWIETISDPYQREQLQDVIKSKGVDTATGLMDMTRIIQGTLGDVPVMFFSKDDFNNQHGSGRGIALLQGDRPVIHISLDLTKGTKEDPFYNLAHEAFHVFDEAAQLSDKTSELKQALVGKYATDATGGRQLIHEGLLDPAEVQRRFQQYADHFQGEEKAKLDAMSPAEKSDFVASELGAEYFARMVRGYKTDSLLRGFTGASRQLADYALLQSASQSLSRIAGALERGFGVKPVDSVLFPDLKQASPQINAMLRTIVRTRNKLNEAISKADENPLILSKSDLSNPIAAKMAVDGGMAKVDPATGKPVMLTKDEMLAHEKQLFDSVLKVVAGTPIEDTSKPFARVVDGAIEGPLSQQQIKALVDSPLVPSQIKQKISAMNTLINEGRSAFINYGAATKKTKNRLTGQERTVYSSKIPVSMREGAFYDMRVSKAGNPYVRMLDLDKVRSALTRRYQSTGSFGPYTSMGEVVGDLAKFFNNLDKGERRQLSADLFGADKAEFLTNLVREKTPGGTASPFFRSIRLDRLISTSPRDFVGKINPEIFSETFGRWMPEQNKPGMTPLEEQDIPLRISTRNPTKSKTENPLTQSLTIDRSSVESNSKTLGAISRTLGSYPGSKFESKGPSNRISEFLNFVTDNLLWLHDQIPENIRERSKLWYDGARKLTENWSEKYNKPREAIAGVIASLSPQKDWYQNVAMAQSVFDFVTQKTTAIFDDRLQNWARSAVTSGPKPKRLIHDKVIEAMSGKMFKDLTSYEKAVFLRVFDEVHNDRSFKILSPEGDFLGYSLKKNGEKSRYAWGDFRSIAKAITIAENPTREVISNQLGTEHKVRSFFNNILLPNNMQHGDVTIDTHAVAAALLLALAGSDSQVAHNFGAKVGKSKVTGVSGTYGLYADAYRNAAAQRGILPREMQSITWEAVRGLFSPEFKDSKANKKLVEDAWKRYKYGQQSIHETRSQILQIAGGITDPTWLGSNHRPVAQNEPPSYSGKLPSPGNMGEPGSNTGRGSGLAGMGEKRLTSPDIRWMPSKRVGEADVVESSHGFRIVKPDGRQFRLYGPNKALLGVFATQGEAEAFAEKNK